MGYNWQFITMKKLLLGLVLFLTVGIIGVNRIQASNTLPSSDRSILTIDVNDAPRAYVNDVVYKSDGSIVVYVRTTKGSGCHRVKVTPVDRITGTITEGALYCDACESSGNVTFHCKAGKEGDAASCALYDFKVEIVD